MLTFQIQKNRQCNVLYQLQNLNLHLLKLHFLLFRFHCFHCFHCFSCTNSVEPAILALVSTHALCGSTTTLFLNTFPFAVDSIEANRHKNRTSEIKYLYFFLLSQIHRALRPPSCTRMRSISRNPWGFQKLS